MRKKNDLHRPIQWGLVACVLACVLATQTRADEGIRVQLHRFESPEIRALATAVVRKWIHENHSLMPVKWHGGPLSDFADIAEVDLDDDGFPELFLQIGLGDACGIVGCDTFIYRKTANRYVRICEEMMYDTATSGGGGPIVLEAKENGYHLIDAGEAIIHWSKQKNKRTGDLCYAEGKPGFK